MFEVKQPFLDYMKQLENPCVAQVEDTVLVGRGFGNVALIP